MRVDHRRAQRGGAAGERRDGGQPRPPAGAGAGIGDDLDAGGAAGPGLAGGEMRHPPPGARQRRAELGDDAHILRRVGGGEH